MFTSGPRLNDGPNGDPRRQAVASLRGYAYQLYASALAWLALAPEDQLFLEVAEDYAVASREAIEAVQVKDIAGSGNISIRTASVRSTLESFVDLVARNPGRRVSLRFLTTASIGLERAEADRIGTEPSLLYWRRAAAGADVGPLRAVLNGLDLKPECHAFIDACDDEALRSSLLRRIHWDCGAVDLIGLRQEIGGTLLAVGESRAHPFTIEEIQQAEALLLQGVLDAVLASGARKLTPLDRETILQSITHTSVPRRQWEAMLRGLNQPAASSFGRPQPLRPVDDTPLPVLLAPRPQAVNRLVGRVRSEGLSIVTGATGMGKSLLARLCGRATGGSWMIADFVGLTIDQTTAQLDGLLGAVAITPFEGLILDDLNELEVPSVQVRAARLRAALARQDRLCLVTAYRPPSARVRAALALTPEAVQPVTNLDEEEVDDLISAAGGDARAWGQSIYVAAAGGHPQLIQATIADLQHRVWPEEELERLRSLDFSGMDIAEQRLAARRRLMEAAPQEARTLLYRLSLLIGAFERDLALAVGQNPPPVGAPGELLDTLIGPWIDPVGKDRLRISPLLSDAGTQVLPTAEQLALHRVAATFLISETRLDVRNADAGFLHALLAKAEEPLTRLAIAVVGVDHDTLGRLSVWLTALRSVRADRTMFPENPTVSRLLRLAQVLLEAESEQRLKLEDSWSALKREIAEEPDLALRHSFEYMALAKALLCRSLVDLPDWLDHLVRFDQLTQTDPIRRAQFEALEAASGEGVGSPIGFYFLNIALGIGSVSALSKVFDRLHALEPKQRDRLLIRLREHPEEITHVINHPWTSEHKRDALEGRSAARAYDAMARQAAQWGYFEIAMRCQVARAVMLDEYSDDEAGALAALAEAEASLGLDLMLSRARAKIAYRRKRHGDALALMREVAASRNGSDAVEQAFLCREAAISATEVGELEEARTWFSKAAEAAGSARSLTLKPMAIGLIADLAIADFRCGRTQTALAGLADALEQARSLSPETSLKATYCHKALGHACLWLNGQITQERFEVEGIAPTAPPGFCSNPEPMEEIRELPRASIEGSFYLLAIADIRLGSPLELDHRLDVLLGGRHVFTMEALRRRTKLEHAMESFHWQNLAKCLGLGLEALVLGVKYMQAATIEDRALPIVDGSFPILAEELRRGESAQIIIDEAFFALTLLAKLKGTPQAQSHLDRLSDEVSQLGYPTPTYLDDPRGRLALFHKAWVDANRPCAAEDLFLGCVRILEWTRGSVFGQLLLPDLGRWAGQRWNDVATQQSFRLLNPQMTVPAILAAAGPGTNPPDRLAAILRAADRAFRIRMEPAFRAMFSEIQAPNQTH